MLKIIHPLTDEFGQITDGVAVIHPTGEMPIADVARKDVPQGVPYMLIDGDAIPADRTFRAAWEAEFDTPDGYGDPAGYWADQAQGPTA